MNGKDTPYSGSFYTRTPLPYILLLEKPEWKVKRELILQRDGFRCQNCGAGEDESELHVHHKCYIEGLDPWEYNDSDLVTLCEHCHNDTHRLYKVPYYQLRNGKLVLIEKEPCKRCGGAGVFPEYRHVLNGICFRCLGQRFEEAISFVRKYERENVVPIENHFPGYDPLDNNVISAWIGQDAAIQCARIEEGNVKNSRLSVDIVLQTGRILHTYLDYSYEASPGDYLDIHSLLFRLGRHKDGSNYIIVRDRFIPLDNNTLSRIVYRETRKEIDCQITRAYLTTDKEFGPEKKIVVIETLAGDNIALTPYGMEDIHPGQKLELTSLKYRVDEIEGFGGAKRLLYSIAGRILK